MRQQGFEMLSRQTRQATQHVLQVGEGVDAVPLACLRQRVQHRRGLPALVAASEQVVLAADGDGTQRAIRRVVVYFQEAMLRDLRFARVWEGYQEAGSMRKLKV